MSTWGSDPSATRPPPEGGWFRFGPELPDPAARPTPEPLPDATWSPIPSFLPSVLPDVLPDGGGRIHPPPDGGLPAPTLAAARTAWSRRLPATVVDYPRLLRGPAWAWWRPVLTAVVFIALYAMLSVLPFLLTAGYGLATGVENPEAWIDEVLADDLVLTPGSYLFLNLTLILLIPAAFLSVWAVHRIRPRYLSSVAGGLRWRWLLRCVAVLAPLWGVYLVVSTVVDPPQTPRSDAWLTLLVMGLLTTPWQAEAEEYAFRGWVLQNIGSYFARPLLAFVVPTVIGTAAFTAAHGSADPWIVGELVVFSVAASIMTWRTGGLEAAIVMHAVNNLGLDIILNLVGGLEEALIGAETRGTPLSFVVSLVLHAVAVALVLWQARRTRVDRHFRLHPH